MMRHPVLITALLAPLCALAAPSQTPACPPNFPAADLHLSPLASGWKPAVHKAPLVGIGFYDGPPEQQALLQPDEADGKTMRWQLPPPATPQGIWLECSYGDGSLTLARALATVPATCTAHTAAAKAGKPSTVTLTCEGTASAD